MLYVLTGPNDAIEKEILYCAVARLSATYYKFFVWTLVRKKVSELYSRRAAEYQERKVTVLGKGFLRLLWGCH